MQGRSQGGGGGGSWDARDPPPLYEIIFEVNNIQTL